MWALQKTKTSNRESLRKPQATVADTKPERRLGDRRSREKLHSQEWLCHKCSGCGGGFAGLLFVVAGAVDRRDFAASGADVRGELAAVMN